MGKEEVRSPSFVFSFWEEGEGEGRDIKKGKEEKGRGEGKRRILTVKTLQGTKKAY